MSERKAVIKNADMSEDMQQDAVDCASQALEKYNIEKVRIIPRFTNSLFASQSTFKYFLSKMSRVSL
jgi:Dynein light chain type 1